MQPRILLAVAAGLALAGAAGVPARAQEQNEAPFTIRYPPDGATVREKVKVRIPLNSIPVGGYVSLYIDGDFRGAMSVDDKEREALKKAAIDEALAAKTVKDRNATVPAYFVYTWDTKAPVRLKYSNKETVPADGQHTITAKLFVPRAQTAGGSDLKETSSVNVVVQNKFDPGNIGPIKLQYRFIDGNTSNYDRTGQSVVVAGLSQGMNGTGDQELVSFKSDLVVGVEDRYPNGHAIVRNKLRNLEVRQGTNVSLYPSEQLPNSLYQELDPLGNVVYQNSNPSFDEFASLGIPVSTTLELPVLPREAKSPGDVWMVKGKIDIPGTAPDKEPTVELQSKFEGFEWEGGFPTAHIHQSFDSSKTPVKLEEVLFGSIDVAKPAIKYDQDIFLAYRSGKLIKVVRSIQVVGKTSQQIGSGGSAPGAAGGVGGSGMMMGGGGMMPPGGGMTGGGYANMMRRGSGMGGGSSPYGGGGMPGGFTGGYGGMSGGGQRRGGGGKFGGMTGGDEGLVGAGGGMSGGLRGGQSGGRPGGKFGGMVPGGGGGGFMGGGGTGTPNQQITLKSTTTTELNQNASKVAKR